MSDLATLLEKFSSKWIAKYPDFASRILKGQDLCLAGHVAPWDNTSWRVLSSDKSQEYWVEIESGYPSCTCADFTNRGGRCCHIWAVALSMKVAEAIEEVCAHAHG